MKRENGITMITLIITIIIMLILAGVALSMVTGDGAVVEQAISATEKTESSTVEENVGIAWTSADISYFENGKSGLKEEYFTEDNLNTRVPDTGKISNISYVEGGTSTLTYTDLEKNLAYNVEIDSNGKINVVGEPTIPVPVFSDRITAEDYGDKVANYEANGITGWQILYKKGSTVYLIADDYMTNDKLPSGTGMSAFSSTYSYRTTWKEFPISSIANSVKSKFMLSGLNSFGNTYNNYKATAAMLDVTKWTDFVDTMYAEYAIGSPTLDMWIASWNEKYNDNLVFSLTEFGYQVGYDGGNIANNIPKEIINVSEGYSNDMYFPRKSAIDTSNHC